MHQQPASETRWVKFLQSWASSPFSKIRRGMCLLRRSGQRWGRRSSAPRVLSPSLSVSQLGWRPAAACKGLALLRENMRRGEQQGWRRLQVARSWVHGGCCYVRPGHRGVPQAGTQPLGHDFSISANTCGHSASCCSMFPPCLAAKGEGGSKARVRAGQSIGLLRVSI